MREIKGYEGLYSITEDGQVWSHTVNRFIAQAPTTKSKYLYVNLYKNNIRKHKSVHRLVAETYVDNPNNLPEVDHIDANIFNNHYTNLQWVTRKENIYRSYNTKSPVRNYRTCTLYYKETPIKTFVSISDCCRYCKKIGLSYTTMAKYRRCGDYTIKSVTTSPKGRRVEDKLPSEVQSA